jgi:hypothetical protein
LHKIAARKAEKEAARWDESRWQLSSKRLWYCKPGVPCGS